MRGRSLTAATLVLFLTLAHAGGAAGASKPKCKRSPKGHAHSATHKTRCPTNKPQSASKPKCKRSSKRHPHGTHNKRCSTKRPKQNERLQRPPTSPAVSAPPAAPTPSPTPQCPTLTPIPPAIAGQTTIVGYAEVHGGPLGPPNPLACPPLPGGTDPILLKNLSGQTLQSQSPVTGQPFDFVVEPGEYYVVEEPCTGISEMGNPIVAVADKQTRIEVGCNIP
jgi:hypothetical protein